MITTTCWILWIPLRFAVVGVLVAVGGVAHAARKTNKRASVGLIGFML
jgi:hypothetical protein